MTNRLELNWKVDGFIDEQRYYCSETPIDLENLPEPTAVLAGDVRTYIDTDIEIGKTYYVRVGSVKNGVEKIGDEQSIYASNIDLNYKVKLLTSNNTLLDSGYSQIGWVEHGNIAYHIDNEISFEDNAYLLSISNFLFNANWKFEFDFLIEDNTVSPFIELFKNMDGWGTGGLQISVGGQGSGSLQNKLFVGVYGTSPTVNSTDLLQNIWYSAYVEKINTTYIVRIGGITKSANQHPAPSNAQMFIGSPHSTTSKCKLKNIKIS